MADAPASIDAEMSIIGAVVTDPDLYDKIDAWITADAFYFNKNRVMWKAIKDLTRDGVLLDGITVYERVKDKYDSSIESDYVAKCQEKFIGSNNVEHHSKIVWQRHLQREALKISKELAQAADKSFDKIEPLLKKHNQYMEELYNLQPHKDRNIENITRIAKDYILNQTNIIRFNIPYLDHSAGGMTRGELSTLGGRPGNGKTVFMLNVVQSLVESGLKVVLFNREMTNPAATTRMIIMESDNLKVSQLRKGEIYATEEFEIEDTIQKINKKYENLIMLDDIRTLDDSVRELKRLEPDVFIDDYIQLVKVRNNGKRDRRFDIEDIMQEYKWLAKKLNASGFLVSQLNREIEKRIDPVPTMADYAEGATIEQMSESCYFLFYGYYFDPTKYSNLANEFIVRKARYGELGTYPIGFNGNRCKFYTSEKKAKEDLFK